MSKVDWETAPEDAQFYSLGRFRKYESDKEFCWKGERWLLTSFDGMELHEQRKDFEMCPVITVYTGQMTANQLRNTKIRIESEDHRNAFIDMVDYAFNSDFIGTNLVGKPFYFCGNDGSLSHQHNDFNYFNNHRYTEIKWQPAVRDETTPELEAKSGTKDKAEDEHWDGEGLPPNGFECEWSQNEGLTWHTTMLLYQDHIAFLTSGYELGKVKDPSVLFRPIKSDREKWCDEVRNKTGLHFDSGALEAIFDEGFAKVPE